MKYLLNQWCRLCADYISPEKKTFDRGSYMSAHVLLSLLNKLGKRDTRRPEGPEALT